MITSNSDTFGIFGLKILKIADGQFTIVWCRSSCPTSISVFGWCIAEVRKYDNCILSLCLFAYIEIECLRNTGYKASLCFSTLEYEGTIESLLHKLSLTKWSDQPYWASRYDRFPVQKNLLSWASRVSLTVTRSNSSLYFRFLNLFF